MKRIIKLLSATALISSFNIANAQTQINPQAGINLVSYSAVPAGMDVSGQLGFRLGSEFRFGGRFFLQPGLFYLTGNTDFTYNATTGTLVQQVGDVKTNGLNIRLLGGWRILNTDVFGLRLAAGPTYTSFFQVQKNTSNNNIIIKEEDFNKGTVSIDAGLGFDILFLTLDIGYSYGFSDAIKTNANNGLQEAPKYQMVYINAGINLGSGKK